LKRKHCFYSFIVFVLILLFSGDLNLSAQGIINPQNYTDISNIGFKENTEARIKLKSKIFAPLYEAFKFKPEYIYEHESGATVKFYTIKSKKALYMLMLNNRDRGFPILGQGNYIVKRSLKDGRFIQVKIFVRNDPDSFIRIYPFKDRSYFDLTLYGFPLFREVVLPINFCSVLTCPFSEIMELSQNTIDWSLVLNRGNRRDSENLINIVKKIRKETPHLKDADDGALDADGHFVFIKDGKIQAGTDAIGTDDTNTGAIGTDAGTEQGGFNCSGFAKWVVDGFYYPLTGHFLDINTIKHKDKDVRGNRWSLRYEKERDPYFGLDWSRNLAVAILEAREHIKITNPEVVDVRNSRYIKYVEDVGYPVKDIKFIMFWLAKLYPDYFFIGSVNKEFGKDPVLRQHFHVIVLFPYFDSAGAFRVAVMERNTNTNISSLIKRYRDNYIHLVKIKAEGTFKPIFIE